MKNVLVTGGTNFFAQRIARRLGEQFKVVFADAKPIPKILLQSGKYVDLPLSSSSSFNHELLSLALDHSIDMVIPLRKEEIIQLSTCKDLFREYGITLIVPTFDSLNHLQFITNPGKEFTPEVLIDGETLTGERLTLNEYTGVCVLSDTGEDALFCCLDD